MRPVLAVLLLMTAALACGCYHNPPPSVPDTKIQLDTISDTSNLYWGIASTKGTYLDKGYFFINHNDKWKIPYWVGYYLSDSNLVGDAPRLKHFRSDPDLPDSCRAKDKDYTKSGYDRGHMAPAACFKRSTEAMRATFVLSNAAPQTDSLNRVMWKGLEQLVRDLVKSDSISHAWVFTGNVFMDADSHWVEPDSFVGEGRVAVPTHCFKAILFMTDDSIFTETAFLMPNQSESLPEKPEDYRIKVEKLEEITGWDFFVKWDQRERGSGTR